MNTPQRSVKITQANPSPESMPKAAASQGLTSAEAQRRLDQYGYNELEEKNANPILKFFSYFWGPIPWMIEAAAILSALVRHYEDLAIILALLIVNAVVGFWEEYQAGNTIAALKQKLAVQARVKRDARWINLPAREIVPGDMIRLRLGDIIPADAKLLEGDEVQVDQSALTGESLPVTHKSGDTVYSGSVLKQGEIEALVTATGKKTYFGKTAHLVEEAQTVSHFQRAVLRIGNYLIVIAITLAALILIVSILRGDPLLTVLQFVLVLTVAAIPVAMPTVLSVTMAVGARILAAKQAVVSKLASIEEMAGMDILCSDKTGTLTQNKLTLSVPYTIGCSDDQAILAASLASREEDNDPIDLAVIHGLKDEDCLKDYQVLHFKPFDPVTKRTEALVKGPDGAQFKVTKGAPQVIVALTKLVGNADAEVEQAIEQFAQRGFRSLGVAQADGDETWRFLGILPLSDPPRADSKETIEKAESTGIDIKMVTGDQAAIGKEIARELGLGTNILNASVLEKIKGDQASEITDLVEHADGFAQVFPEHKYRIVQALQTEGHIVGMTGDGVNDAPALKKADAGIAVSGATDAARSAADIVLLTPGLSVIIDAIHESRKIFQRMNSYATYRIAETIRVLLFMTLSILVFNYYPVTAIMIVLLALLNDGAILSIAWDNVTPSNRPEAWNMRRVLGIATVLGVIGVIATFGLFYIVAQVFHLSQPVVQSLMYLKLSVAGQLTIFITRTRGPFWSIKPSKLMLAAVGTAQLIATLITTYGVFMAPIGWGWALAVWGYALVWFLINDRVKLLAYKWLKV